LKIIDIPCRPHIKNWLVLEYGQEPIEANQRNFLGGLIRNASIGINPDGREVKLPGNSNLQVVMSNPLAGVTSKNVANELGYLLEEQFTLAVVSFVRGYIGAGKTSYQAIIAFYDHYKIEPDDYDMESVRKIWRDHEGLSAQGKKKKEKRILV
jgi:hypothetical protein